MTPQAPQGRGSDSFCQFVACEQDPLGLVTAVELYRKLLGAIFLRYHVRMKTVVYTARAAKQLDDLPPPVQEQVTSALTSYAISGRGDVIRMSGTTNLRMRVGRYRVIFDEDGMTVLTIYVGKRETSTYSRK